MPDVGAAGLHNVEGLLDGRKSDALLYNCGRCKLRRARILSDSEEGVRCTEVDFRPRIKAYGHRWIKDPSSEGEMGVGALVSGAGGKIGARALISIGDSEVDIGGMGSGIDDSPGTLVSIVDGKGGGGGLDSGVDDSAEMLVSIVDEEGTWPG